MQLLIFFFLLSTERFLRSVVPDILALYPCGWWAQMEEVIIWLLRNQVFLILALVLADFGGLKWTRTIDLTLIRRVL